MDQITRRAQLLDNLKLNGKERLKASQCPKVLDALIEIRDQTHNYRKKNHEPKTEKIVYRTKEVKKETIPYITNTCRGCKKDQSWLTDFDRFYDMNGAVVVRELCKTCRSK